MKKIKTTAWAVKEPHGFLHVKNIKRTRVEAIEWFTNDYNYYMEKPISWDEIKKRGFKCIKVQITEL